MTPAPPDRDAEHDDPRVDLSGDGSSGTDLAGEVMRRLGEREARFGRYELKGEIARGGQGAVLRVWDADLRRELAMKVILGQADTHATGGTPPTNAKSLGRFLEEAQVTGQLDHPGIVPVHELGLDRDGRVYFTMKLVRGRDLAAIFELVHEGREGWTVTRALGLMLKVCEAMAYAHYKGVVHRDLKPANVMVGRFGAVYVMDWGLARLVDREDGKDIRVRPVGLPPTLEVQSDRQQQAQDPSSSPLFTMDGDVVGTPAYMPPEQALGRLQEVGPRSDVYAVGAMLYHLLTGQMPYVPRGAKPNAYAVWSRVQEGPPRPLAELAPDLPGELVAICEKAMARELAQRYASMEELAIDLRAFLEGRVVKAYGGGALVEARKWMQRNTALAASLAAAMVLALGGLGAVGYVQAEGRRAADEQRARAEDSERRAVASEAEAREQARIAAANEALARRRADDVLRLSALQQLDDLIAEADALWPAVPEHVAALEAWLGRAHELLAQLPQHVAKREELRARTGADPALTAAPTATSSATSSAKRGALASNEDRWWEAQLTKLIDGLQAFGDPVTGCIAGSSPERGWGVERRLAFAHTVSERTLTGSDARRLWNEAVASIADPTECPAYDGLVIAPQLGLLPLGRDPDSGLWEFWHVQSGDAPSRDGSGRLQSTASTGIVLVLLPAGRFWMGAQALDPGARRYDPAALDDESPVHEVAVSPGFLSKYELTQGQWERFTLANPSYYGPDGEWDEWSRADEAEVLLHPVEQVSWEQARRALERMGLALPSEAQWEHGARAGTDTPWFTGDAAASLQGAANLSDGYRLGHGGRPGWRYEGWDDGYAVHAPVGSFRPNPFGLHDMVGNVWEWCLDAHEPGSYAASRLQDPVFETGPSGLRVFRGGSFYDPADDARASVRNMNAPDGGYDDIGVRPARALSP